MRQDDAPGPRSTPPSAAQPATRMRRQGPAGPRPWTVLIVDPDTVWARHLASVLAPSTVAIVGTAYAAIEAIQQRIPDLIVTELDLPDHSGVELIARVHTAPTTHNVLLLVATHRASVRDKIAAFQAGADDYLVKPVDPQQFVAHAQQVSRFLRVLGRDQPT